MLRDFVLGLSSLSLSLSRIAAANTRCSPMRMVISTITRVSLRISLSNPLGITHGHGAFMVYSDIDPGRYGRSRTQSLQKGCHLLLGQLSFSASTQDAYQMLKCSGLLDGLNHRCTRPQLPRFRTSLLPHSSPRSQTSSMDN